MRIAINGFGRIGRNFLRAILQDTKASSQLEVVAINVGPVDPEGTAYVFKYDSNRGIFSDQVIYKDGCLEVCKKKIKVLAEKDAVKLPWAELKIDWVVDCSGRYTKREQAEQHIKAGAKKVLISAPAQGADCTIVLGVNGNVYKKDTDTIVSLGSCTTNALMPMLKVIADSFGIESAFAVTAHAYTQTQSLLDGFGDGDMRKERAAAINIIPTTTGAARMVAEVLPELAGKVSASALRVPVANVSLVDVTWSSGKSLKLETIQKAFVDAAAQQEFKQVIAITDEQLVSSDYNGNSHSVIVDSTLTQVQGALNRVSGWYDNEWAYSVRLKDFLIELA
jgi:glyceraldehyde 3-phosphate dehydrogenase